jgi:hypothetical protein
MKRDIYNMTVLPTMGSYLQIIYSCEHQQIMQAKLQRIIWKKKNIYIYSFPTYPSDSPALLSTRKSFKVANRYS